ncbi:MAG: helix-turn-helix transcriptional regulator [Pyrinomonadaceae bacterium]|nr:helix-turn-helix transcriptional regulator [Pyrinomonadaceae bacterium]
MNGAQFHKVAKALADPRRFEIFETIAASDEMCCGSISDCFPVSQATVSHHLKELADAELIEARCEGQFKYFSVRREVLTAYVEELVQRINAKPRAGVKPRRGSKAGVRTTTHSRR